MEAIGHYRVIRSLGSGGMGEVVLAEDVNLGRQVALKILSPESASDPMRVKRFAQEAKAASLISHPNAIHIYEVGESHGTHFIAMEYVEGETLDSKIQRGFLQAVEVARLALAIADALKEAHGRGIVHRDLKPANIMIDRRGQLKVLDFGLAKILPAGGGGDDADLRNASTLVRTDTGVLVGTVQYMSPEQAVSRPVDSRSDIFSLGIILYELATGRRPFSASSPGATIDRILHGEPESIARTNHDFPEEFERVIFKCLRKEAGERYQSSADLIADLRSVLRQLGGSGSAQPGGSELAGERVITTEYHIPRNAARGLFVALQVLYLAMYLAALRWTSGMTLGLSNIFGHRWGGILAISFVAGAMLGIAVRLHLIASVVFDHVQTGVRYRKIFPGLFLLDMLWSIAPFGLSLVINELFALACIPPLVFSPFSQRTLIRSAYDLYAGRRTSTGK